MFLSFSLSSEFRVFLFMGLLFLGACGESKIDLQKEFGVRGEDACEEVNQAVSIILSQHLTKGPEHLDDLYRKTFLITMDGWQNAFSESGLDIRFDSRLTQLKRSEAIDASRRMSDCSDFVYIQRSIDQAYRENYGVGLDDLVVWDNRELFRYFLDVFADQLDPFSRYEREESSAFSYLYEYGALLDLVPLGIYGRSPDSLDVVSVHSESSFQKGDKLLAVRFNKSFGSRISDYWWTIEEILEEDELGRSAIFSLLSSSPYQGLEVRVSRGEEVLEINPQALNLRQRAPRVLVERESGTIYIRVFSFDADFDAEDYSDIFSSQESTSPSMTRDLLLQLRSVLNSYIDEFPTEEIPLPHYVLDFRDNPGGAMSEALGLLQMFLRKNESLGFYRSRASSDWVSTYVEELDRRPFEAPWAVEFFEDKRLKNAGLFQALNSSLFSEKDYFLKSSGTAVLINERSASASELVSMALLQTRRVAGFGKVSFGKMVGQSSIKFLGQSSGDDPLKHLGGEIWFTTFEFLGPRKERGSGGGILPHFVVSDPLRESWREDCENGRSPHTCNIYRASDLGPSDIFVTQKALAPAPLESEFGRNFSAPVSFSEPVEDFQRQVVYDFLAALFPKP